MALASLVGMALVGAIHAAAEPSLKDVQSIRALMSATWDKPDAKLAIAPIVVHGDHAVASWTQGKRGGRALLRKIEGAWVVVLCSGDPLTHAAVLAEAGVPSAAAASIARELSQEEGRLPSEQVALFSTFEGVVAMDQHHGAHPGHAEHH